jgi:DNA-binding MarR family transcriptional regulator
LRRFLSFSESVTAAVGVTSQQYQALLVLITASGGVRMKDLAQKMMLVPHGAVQLVDRLSDAGLVVRQPDDQDRRTVVIIPTARAVEVMKVLVTAHARELRQQEGLLAEALSAVRRLGR